MQAGSCANIRSVLPIADEEEFTKLAAVIQKGSPMFPGNFSRALEQFDQNDDGLIDRDEFRDLNKRYPMVLCVQR